MVEKRIVKRFEKVTLAEDDWGCRWGIQAELRPVFIDNPGSEPRGRSSGGDFRVNGMPCPENPGPAHCSPLIALEPETPNVFETISESAAVI